MRALIVCVLAAVCVTAAWAQSARQGLEVTVATEARFEPSPEAPVNATLAPRQRIYFMEVAGEFIRIDAEGIAGPAYVPTDSVRARPPISLPVAPQGRCDCPDNVRSDNRICGRASSFCQSGGRQAACNLGGRTYEAVCGRP